MKLVLLESLQALWPEIIVGVGALLTALAAAFWPNRRHSHVVAITSLLGASFALLKVPVPPSTATFFDLVMCDPFSYAFRLIIILILALTVLMVTGATDNPVRLKGEYLSLVLFSGMGMMLMAESNHLLMMYLAIEMVSLCSYLLVAFGDDSRSSEAALKYLVYGALASGIMVFGLSLLFGLTGRLSFPGIHEVLPSVGRSSFGVLIMSLVMIISGMAFKISLFPFHMWTPDAYEGAPVPVAALLSVGPKAAGLALLVRLMAALAPAWSLVEPLFIALTVATMTFGNLVALTQTNVKRMLAYSTIAQVGYLLIGFIVNNSQGLHAMLMYLMAYVFMNMGAFACVQMAKHSTGSESLEGFSGLSQRSPATAALCTVFFLSLAGIPPLLGFFGKFLILGAALDASYYSLAFVAIANSAISLYYYVRVIRQMYLVSPEDTSPLTGPQGASWVIWGCGLATLMLGLFPNALMAGLKTLTLVSLL